MTGKFKLKRSGSRAQASNSTSLSQLHPAFSQGSWKDRSDYGSSGYIQACITSSEGPCQREMNGKRAFPGDPLCCWPRIASVCACCLCALLDLPFLQELLSGGSDTAT